MTLYKEAEVDRGIALLDEKVPGWKERIDKDRLDMWWEDTCILGQLSGGAEFGYGAMCDKLGIGRRDYSYGFNLQDGIEDHRYDELLETWLAKLG